jgi:prepilin-type N-terminal cleavage/methylation domain-containing protein
MSRGFTLVEVLVAMVVASIALLAGFATLAAVGDRSRHAEAAVVAALEGAGPRAQLVEWIAGARLRHGQERFQGIPGENVSSPSDELVMPTNASTPLDEPVTVVHLFIDRDASTPERGLVAELIGAPDAPTRRVELVPAAGRLELRYFTNARAGGVAEWHTQWIENVLPDGVELTLHAAAGDTLPPLLRLPIRVALETIR